jgi:rhamnosyltransferase
LVTLPRPPLSEWRGRSLLLTDLEETKKEPGPAARARTAAVFVAYHPDAAFAERVRTTLGQVDHVYVVDNSPSAVSGKIEAPVLGEGLLAGDRPSTGEGPPAGEDFGCLGDGVTVIRNLGNAGVGRALNQGAVRAIEDGYGYLLLMNQDDAPHPGMVAALHAGLGRWPGRAAIAAPVRIDRNVGPSEDVREHGYIWPVIAVGAAGSLLDLLVYQEAGPFREDLFVDQVDYEYCLRVRRRGYDVVQTGDAVLENALGASSRHHLAGLSVVTTNHSPLRRYYIARNRLIVARDYPDFPQYRRSQRYASIRELRNVVLFEERRMAKLRMAARGVWDYWRGRSGQFPAC